jgi:hypothetical protein
MGGTSVSPGAPASVLTPFKPFPMLDENGEPSAPGKSLVGRAPFGVLTSLTVRSFCTLTHLTKGRVGTSAHCLWKNNPADFVVQYYDRDNVLRVGHISKILYAGASMAIDLALLEVDAETAENWDTIEEPGQTWMPPDYAHPADNFAVTIWAFDPIYRHPQSAARYGEWGAVFRPKRCEAGYREPKLFGDGFQLKRADSVPRARLYYDSCTEMPVGGNSGSLITLAGQLRTLLGFHQRVVLLTPYDLSRYFYFDFENVEGKVRTRYNEEIESPEMYWAGIDAAGAADTDPVLKTFISK